MNCEPVFDHGVTVLDVVHVDLTHSVDAVEELDLARQPPLERGEAVESGTFEVVTITPVRTTGAATAVGHRRIVD